MAVHVRGDDEAPSNGTSELGRDLSGAGVGLRERLELVDPAVDGWDTEVVHGRTGKHLKHLEELLHDPAAIAVDELKELASEAYASQSFAMEDEGSEFDNRDFGVVRRAFRRSDEPAHRGLAGLAAALRELVAPFAPDHEVHVHFKQYRVELEEGRARTRSLYEASGHDEAGRLLQQTATIDFEWEYDGEVARLVGLESPEVELVHGRTDGEPQFVDATRAVLGAQPSFAQLLRSMPELSSSYDAVLGMELFGHHGLAVADFDGDGLDDVYLCQPGGFPNLLYLRMPDGSAREAGAEWGLDLLDTTRAALAIDLDSDGDQDLVLGMRSLVIFENTGSKFEQRLIVPAESSYGISAADPDRDGDLDLYVCCYGRVGRPPTPYHDARNGMPNLYLRNEGDFAFVNATNEVGLGDDNTRHSFSSSWADYDSDGDIDLYVANDYGRNCLYRNTDGHFENVAPEAGVEDISAGMSVSWGDYDADGHLDLYVGNMFSSAGNRITYQRQFRGGEQTDLEEFQRHARGNSLFRNRGDGTFEDVSVESATTMGRWSWSSRFMDIDSDGLQDIVVANGYLTNTDSTDL